MSETKKPIQKFKSRNIDVSIWQNKGEKGDFLTVSTNRSYKDKEDNWKNTNTMRINDIPVLINNLQKAYDYGINKKNKEEGD